MQLPGGIPRRDAYRRLLHDRRFHEMEEFAALFEETQKDILQGYWDRWTSDPLHQWSRQWEYPFTSDRLSGTQGRVLDAGSGITFFPYYLAQRGFEVIAYDSDPELEETFRSVREGTSLSGVSFTRGDLIDLPFANAYFDGVYCVSVLEHVADPRRVLEEFGRVLRPGGTLILTLDVALDAGRHIPPEQAEELLVHVEDAFSWVDSERPPMTLELSDASSLVTTTWVASERLGNLPWRPTGWRRLRGAAAGPPRLTVYCGEWRRRS